jgi:Tol biopolymer transport system component
VLGRKALVSAVACLFLAGCYDGARGSFKPEPAGPRTVVFASDRDETHGEIYSMLDDGTHVVRLTHNGVQDAAPLLSPDGTKITFRRELNPANVFVMNVDGSSPIGLAPGKRAEWSPDGTKLALVADSLAVMNSDGTGIQRFGVGASYVAWSPDGAKLAYVATGLGGQSEGDIYTINPNGTGTQRVTTDGTNKNSLAWSPDGTRFLYSAPGGVYIIKVDGSGLTSPVVGRSARWSPDGSRIIFVTDALDGNDEIYSVRADGTDPKNLSRNAANESDPDWGPRK